MEKGTSEPKIIKRPRGRPFMINDEVIERLKGALHAGLKKNVDLAAFIGVAVGTFYEWFAKGRNDLVRGKQTVHAKLVSAIDAAKINAKAMHAGNVLQGAIKGYPTKKIRTIEHRNAKGELISTHTFREEIEAQPDPRISLEFLARHWPDEWEKVNRVSLTWRNKAAKRGATEQEIDHVINGIAKSFARRAGMQINDEDQKNAGFFDQLLGKLESLEGMRIFLGKSNDNKK